MTRQLIARTRDAVHRLEDSVLCLLMTSLMLLAVGQIAMRNLFGISFLWSEPLIRHLVLWCSFLGALIACRMDRHIRIDAVQQLLQGRWKLVAQLVASLASAFVCGLLTWVAGHFLADERAYGGQGVFDLPTWILLLVFPLTFGFMTMRYLGRSARSVACLAGKGLPPRHIDQADSVISQTP